MAHARWWHLTLFIVGLFGLLLQLWITVTYRLPYDGHVFGTPMRVWNFLSYFTVWSNILVVATAWLLFRDPLRAGPAFTVVRHAALVMITATGIIYALILAATWDPTGWIKVADRTMHYVVPLLAVVTYIVAGPRPRFSGRSLLRMVAIPLAWGAYTFIRSPFIGYRGETGTKHWWPYDFVNVDAHGVGRIVLNVVVVAIVIVGIGAVYLWLDRKLPPSREPATPALPEVDLSAVSV